MSLYSKIFRIVRLLLFIQIFTANYIFSQTKAELENKKSENIEQIQYTRNMLDKMTKTKETSLNKINLLQKSIELRQDLIENITQELSLITYDIQNNSEEIQRINKRIEALKLEYAEIIRNSYKLLDNEYALMYILSSQDINQVYLRLKYLKYLTNYRKNLISDLDSEKLNYLKLNKTLTENKNEGLQLLKERKQEVINLDKDKKQKITLVKKLQVKEGELRKEIQRREKIMLEIETELKRLIEEEARKARVARKTNILTESEKLLSSEFVKNEGKLPWPLERGVVTGKFGKQNHAVLKNIKVSNLGIDITTVKAAKVRAIFDGEVSSIIPIMGANFTVMIKHGDFYTVYQNLVDLKIKTGDKVNTKEFIGTAFTDMENITKIHFAIYKDKFLDPESWLSK